MKTPGSDHPITLSAHPGRIVVRFHGTVVADTQDALALKEASYETVLYIPRKDAKLAHFEPSDRRTHCPYKGDASYFHLSAERAREDNAAWSYATPFPAMKAIEGRVAFYANKVTISQS